MKSKNIDKPAKLKQHKNSTIETILSAARNLFYSKGYEKTTVRDIASKANVNLGLIPYYFGSKESLASIICFDMLDELYDKVNDMDLSALTNSEKMYVSNLLVWEFINDSEGLSNFYSDLVVTTSIVDSASKAFIKLSKCVISDYNLSVTDEQNEIYLTVIKGAEKLMMLKKYHNEIDLTYYEMSDILISNYFYNIGISDEQIRAAISNSKVFLHTQFKN